MALVLKKITLEGGLAQAENGEERSLKHTSDEEWTTFCSGPLYYFETKWTKKLEEYGNDAQSDAADGNNSQF